MSILFAAIAREMEVLAQTAACVGNFPEVTAQILSKIPPQNEKRSYSSGNYLYHYLSENKIVFFCITTEKYPQVKAFLFLNDIHKKFQEKFGDTPAIAIPYAMMRQPNDGGFARVIENEMTRYNENKIVQPKAKVDLDELKNIMIQNVEKISLRGERLENLAGRVDGLSENTNTYRRNATNVQRKYWWQNMKLNIILSLVFLGFLYFVGVIACGGVTWRNCIS